MTLTYSQRLNSRRAVAFSPTVRVALAFAMLVAVEVIHLILTHIGPLPGDRWAAYHYAPWMINRQPHLLRSLSNLLTTFGTAPLAVLVFAITIWRLLARRRFDEIVGLAIVYCAVLANAILKAIYGPTPLWQQTNHWVANFPSGHATYATAIFGYLALLAYRHNRRWAMWLAISVIVLMAPTRVTSGSHLPSDVLAGTLLGGTFLMLAGVWLTVRDRTAGESPANGPVQRAAPRRI